MGFRVKWTPWRLSFILGEKPRDCIFCTKVRENRDRENYILYRGAHNFLILNLYPYNNGHLMIVPYLHVPSLEDLPAEVAGEAALVVPPDRPEALAEAMERVVDDSALRHRLVQEGQRRVASFSWERAARQHLELYRRVARG
mgnify:CR=1 FL=1